MITHECINCGHMELIPLDEELRMQRITCEKCDTTQWLKHSRISPETYSEDMVEVDEKNQSVRLKGVD